MTPQSIGGRRHVQRGWFNLFPLDGAPDHRLIRCRLQFADAAGQPRTLVGEKDVWHGPHPRGGTLHLRLADFARQLTTIRSRGPHRTAALERFGRFFAGQLWDVYRPQHSDA